MSKISMKNMVHLLNKKNSYLVDFQKLNEEELQRFQSDDLSNLEDFYYDREILLNAVDRIDQELKGYSLDQCEDVNESLKKNVLELLKQKRQYIHNILDQDMKIHDLLSSMSLASIKKEKIA